MRTEESVNNPKNGPLGDVIMIDLTQTAAGPYAAELAAFLGAQVFKVESRTRPDLFRKVINASPGDSLNRSSRFNEVNLNKKSISLNLSTEDGRDLLRRLVAATGTVIENFRPGVVERLGVAYSDLVRVRPDLVMVSISSGGRGGPESDYPGYASVFNALGGLGYMTGYPDGPPTEVRDSVDLRVGTTAAFALVAALFHRRRTGRGNYIDMSAREAVASLIGDSLVEYSATHRMPQREGNDLGEYCPYGVFKCEGEDAWVAIAVTNEVEWRALCLALGDQSLARAPHLADATRRFQARHEIEEIVTAWTSKRPAADAESLLLAHGVAASQVVGARELLEAPGLNARGVFRTVIHPDLGQQTVVSPPWRLRSWIPCLSSSPMLGAQTREALISLLGLSETEFLELEQRGVLD